MKLIAHRGNFNGICSRFENLPEYIDEALEAGYDAEIDVWSINGELFLGHDEPQYKIKEKWLLERESKLWCHAKNINAVLPLADAGLHCFFQFLFGRFNPDSLEIQQWGIAGSIFKPPRKMTRTDSEGFCQ